MLLIMMPLRLLMVLAFVAAGFVRASDPDANLLGDVHTVAVPGLPGPLCVFGPNAFPVIVDDAKSPAPVIAAGSLGDGRVVAFGHEGYFGAEALRTADTARLMANLVTWAGARSPQHTHVVGLHRCPDLEAALKPLDVRCRVMDGSLSLNGIDVLILPAGEIHDNDLPALTAFVRGGGGVIAGLPGWGYLQTHPAASSLAADLPANKLFAPAGIVWADGTIDVGSTHRLTARPDLPKLLNASAALDAIAAGNAKLSPADAALAASTLSRAAQSIPADDTILLPRLQRLAKDHLVEAITSPKSGLLQSSALGRAALTFELARTKSLPPEQVSANPLAKDFPGEVEAGAPRVTRDVDVDLTIPDWHGTGLYAAPGEAITVTVPAGAPKLQVRIGCHSDKLWSLPTWQRAPEVDVERPLKPGVNRVASPFGGSIYVVVPHGAKGTARVSIANAVEAPRFVLGHTGAEAWRSIRSAPGPWAELESRKIILTVPSKFVRTLDDPAVLMSWWDRVADGAADLFQIPRDRPRAERYVADVQISAGYMHSGYPIMTHLDAAPRMVDLPTLRTKGEWGLFHELGHNHQRPEWTFSGTGEVTNNLLPLYLLETLCDHAPVRDAFTPTARQKNEKKYVAAGANFDTWQKDPFLALSMYQQLRDAFGWETYQKVFATYRDLKPDERPTTDLEKHDQWMVRFSRAAGRNLGPFFQHWGIPTSEAARQSIADLPAWAPPSP